MNCIFQSELKEYSNSISEKEEVRKNLSYFIESVFYPTKPEEDLIKKIFENYGKKDWANLKIAAHTLKGRTLYWIIIFKKKYIL